MPRGLVRSALPLAAVGCALWLAGPNLPAWVGAPVPRAFAAQATTASAGSPRRPVPSSDDAAIVHILNRIGFGPRPGDVERVKALGVQQYIDEQLHPARLADASMDGHLSRFTTLRLSLDEIVEQYERPLLDARRERQERDAAAQGTSPARPAGTDVPSLSGPEPAGPAPVDRDPAMPQRRANGPVLELAEYKLLRALYSERQLQEVLTDFWFNHFNVDARKGRTRFLLTAYERDAIRPHVLGRFRDLLGATAHSPAMLFYLDNWLSVDPQGVHPERSVRQRANGRRVFERAMAARPNAPKGLNENYARELLELHTLGVDGGYTQEDVVATARVFTGWTIGHPRNPRLPLGFRFDPRMHDDGAKTVLGHRIAARGAGEGEEVLDILARHPATARFVATKLARRFVSDTPPPALVDAMAARFVATDGDLREVMATLLASAAFWAEDGYRSKVKTPLEFVVSAVRAVGPVNPVNVDVPDARLLVLALQRLGMPLYQCQPPTGYKDTADAWTNTGALVDRMNLAVQIAGRARGSMAVSAHTLDALLAHRLSDTTKATIARAEDPTQAVALTLGSPEFQRR